MDVLGGPCRLKEWIHILGIKAQISKFCSQTPAWLFQPFILWASGLGVVWFHVEGFHMNPEEVQGSLVKISHLSSLG